MPTSYAIALGSNRCGRHGAPERELRAAIAALATVGRVRAVSSLHRTAPLGPSSRRFANAAAIVETRLDPPALLAALKAIERAFGRRGGQRWGARVLDLDIILWSGGAWEGPSLSHPLSVPHRAFRNRAFVLDPLAEIAAGWRDPRTGRTVRQIAARLGKAQRAVDRARKRS